MDNHGTPTPSNSWIRRYVAYQKIQDPSKCWPFGVRCEYSRILDLSCRVPLSNRQRVTQNLEAPEPSARRRNNVVDENNRAIPIVNSSGSEEDSDDDAAYVAAERRRKGKAAVHEISSEFEVLKKDVTQSESEAAEGNNGNDSGSCPVMKLASVSHCPNENNVDEGAQTEALDAVRGYELAVYNGNGTRSESEADIDNGCPKVKHVQPLKSLNGKRKIKAKKPKTAESCKVINCSSDSGRTISDTEPTDSMLRPHVSRRGRLLKPTYKLLQLPNATDAPAGEGTSGSKQEQSKKRRLNAIIARETSMPRIPVSAIDGSNDATLPSTRKRKDGTSIDSHTKQKAVKPLLNRGPRGFLKRHGSQHNRLQSGVASTNGPGVGGQVGVSEPSGSWSVAGQAGQVNGVASQADVVIPNGSGVGGSGSREPTSVAGHGGSG